MAFFQNTVKLKINIFKKAEIWNWQIDILFYQIIIHKLVLFWTGNLEKVKVGGFKCIQVSMYPGELLEKWDNHSVPKFEFKPHLALIFMLPLSRKYVFRVDPSRSDYSRLFWSCRASTISDLPINLRLSRKRVSPRDKTCLLVKSTVNCICKVSIM